MARRVPRALPQFSLELPQSERKEEQPVPIAGDIRREELHLIVDLEGGSLVSPAITTRVAAFPGTAAPPFAPSGGAPASAGRSTSPLPSASTPVGAGPSVAAQATSSSGKLFRVDASSVYVYQPKLGNSSDDFVSVDGATPESLASLSSGPIPFESLKMGRHLGSGTQGSVREVSFEGQSYALKKISVSEALDRNQADVERQARKAAIVRELQMLAKRGSSVAKTHVVGLHNAYFRRDDDGHCDLYILMELMNMSLEDLRLLVAKLPKQEVIAVTQRCFTKHMAGTPVVAPAAAATAKMTSVSSAAGGGSGGGGGSASAASSKKPVVEKMSFSYDAEAIESLCTPLPEQLISVVARDALLGLKHFHDTLRFIHTDIKPANLMFNQACEMLKLADFGCSLEMGPDGTAPLNTVLTGTKLYMSPERARLVYGGGGVGGSAMIGSSSSSTAAAGGSMSPTPMSSTSAAFGHVGVVDSKADIWALGITLLELRSGVHPCHYFRDEFWNYAEYLRFDQMILPANCSAMFYDFVSRMLHEDPEKRWNATQLLTHAFITKYQAMPRKHVAQLVRELKNLSNKYTTTQVQKTLEKSVKTAVETDDPDRLRRAAEAKWKRRPFLASAGKPLPSMEDFPSLPGL